MGSPHSKTSRLAVRSTSSTYDRGNNKNYSHRCTICNKRRSYDYHEQHPLAPGEIPPPGICRRCQKRSPIISKTLGETESIVRIHYYHHSCSCQSHAKDEEKELAFENPPPAELPAYDDAKDIPYITRHLDPPPPPVRTWRKPRLTNNDIIRETLDRFEVGGLGGLGGLTVGPMAG